LQEALGVVLNSLDMLNRQPSVLTVTDFATTIKASELQKPKEEISPPSKTTRNRILRELHFKRRKCMLPYYFN
jgi:hypothetical protein